MFNEDFSIDAAAASFRDVAPAAASLSLRSRSVFSSRQRRSSSAASCAIVFVRSTAAARWPTVKVRLILETMISIYVSVSGNMVIHARFHNAWLLFAARADRPLEATGASHHLLCTPRIDGCVTTIPLSMWAVIRRGRALPGDGSGALCVR
ncbi:hypothetical protein [Rhizobium leguminosarum]|uniref:hypothetical protein n=1 Tax=Rhizobium leguminosarum TaxID=384 RepID=UPI0012F6A229|nr:hypothetical protein [Rhizobium leguminosarum]